MKTSDQLLALHHRLVVFGVGIQESLPLKFRLQVGYYGIALSKLPILVRYNLNKLRILGYRFLMFLMERFVNVGRIHNGGVLSPNNEGSATRKEKHEQP